MEEKLNIIKHVTKPISFLVLALLAVEGLLALMINKLPQHAELIIWGCLSLFFIFIIIVTCLGVWRPEALHGSRRLDNNHSERLADNIYFAMEGYLDNLSPQEKEEAWNVLYESLANEDSLNEEFNLFSKKVGERILKKASIQKSRINRTGRII